jgi:hypothetical protein
MLEESNVLNTELVHFMSVADLNESQAKRLLAILSKFPKLEQARLAEPLLKAGIDNPEVKKRLLSIVGNPMIEGNSIAYSLRALDKYFPGDAEVKNAVKQFYLANFKYTGRENPLSAETILPFLKDDPEIKEFALKKLSEDPERAVEALAILPSTDEEIARAIDSVAKNARDDGMIVLMKKDRQYGKESAKALVRAFFDRPYIGTRENIAEVIKNHPDRDALYEYAKEIYGEIQKANPENKPVWAQRATPSQLWEEFQPAFGRSKSVGCASGFAALTN